MSTTRLPVWCASWSPKRSALWPGSSSSPACTSPPTASSTPRPLPAGLPRDERSVVGAERAGEEADAADQEDQHHEGIEEARRLEVDVEVHQDAGEDDDQAGDE